MAPIGTAPFQPHYADQTVITEHGVAEIRHSISDQDHVPSIDDKEAKGFSTVEITDDLSDDGKEVDGFVKDPFVPFDNLPDEDRNILTFRAMLCGAACGALVNASNLYLGLKTGWTFSANIFGTIVGFAMIKAMEKYFKHVPLLGGDFGPKENGILQTAAMAAGGLSNVFVSAIPAVYQLNLLGTPSGDYWKLVALAAVGGYFGFFFATPLRKFFIIYVARELRLIFPSPSATAVTIRSMHGAVGGQLAAKLKMKALSIAFSGAFLLRVVSQYALGILWDWHAFTWFFIWSGYSNHAIAVENWGWFIEWTPAFIGSGMLVGLNVAISFWSGSLLAWGIIGPTLVKYGVAFGGAASEDPKWDGYINYFSLSKKYATPDHPSPRYWMLWPGVLTMIVVSMVELGCQYRIFVHVGRALRRSTANLVNTQMERRGKFNEKLKAMGAAQPKEDQTDDPATPEQQVKAWMWLSGMLVCLIAGCAVTATLFGMSVGESILAYFLAIVFSLMAVQCTGATDITPLTAASKASQLVLGGVTKGQGQQLQDAQRLNLIGGALANMGANQATDLVSDFRTGFLLNVPPITQWYAQGMATLVAVFLAPAMFVLFSKAYPCINDLEIETCPFQVPSVASWRAVAVAMTDPTFPVPRSSGIFAIVFSIFGAIMVVTRHVVLTGDRAWMRAYWPNMMVMAMAFTIPSTVYGTATLIGAIISAVWIKKNQKQFEAFGYAVAAGFIAGEGIGGVINAIFQVAGIGGDTYGSQIACPGDAC